MEYIGIDPGKSGAMAIINGESVELIPFSIDAYIDRLWKVDEKNAICCLEHVNAMPGNGSVGMFHFGENFGFIQGVLSALHIPYELIRPQKWKKEFSVTADKNTSIEVCKRLFPQVSLLRTERSRKGDDGLAEALLMALYAKRRL